MDNNYLSTVLQEGSLTVKNGIFVSREIAERTVWDTLATENPTHAVISAEDEEAAKSKSKEQIDDIKAALDQNSVLLDYGSGYGRVAKYLLPDMTLAGYIGVDSSYEMLSLFRDRYSHTPAEQRTPLLLVNADIHTLPLKDSSVDVAIVCAVFLHNHKDVVRKAMMELQRVLKPGGKLLVYSSFPRGATLMGVQGHAYQLLLNLLGKPFKNGPVRYYGKREIAKLFEGFAEVELYPVGFGVLPKTLIFLPGPLEKLYRIGVANPINMILTKIIPTSVRPWFAVHYDVKAIR